MLKKFECMEVSYGDHECSVDCLWIKIRESITKGALMLGTCYRPPNQGDKGDKTLLWLLKEVLGQYYLVLMGDFNYPDICWENNTAMHKSSTRFLECTEDCLMLQMLDMLLLEFKILLSTLKTSSRTKTLDFRRANFKMLRSQLQGNKKGFFKYVISKHRGDIGPMLNRAGKPVTNNADKAKVLNTFFVSIFTGVAGPQITGSSRYDNACVDPPVLVEGLVCSLLQGFNPHKSVTPDGIHARVLKEVADIVVAVYNL
ncbi:rna-directed dna polymerase from mobile element jockey- hypothetical protein [Limosa lapponica baueri]|uniref:Uncharacterized protein n=1 Tax=Limosa lapponica baueri TaxID=1758121 RepID=A0A2I0TEN9_LIMLA|nr:rna-directed dna polymerase from mobile element jockey- hypothetical protein [Limosa lapponica baueri]